MNIEIKMSNIMYLKVTNIPEFLSSHEYVLLYFYKQGDIISEMLNKNMETAFNSFSKIVVRKLDFYEFSSKFTEINFDKLRTVPLYYRGELLYVYPFPDLNLLLKIFKAILEKVPSEELVNYINKMDNTHIPETISVKQKAISQLRPPEHKTRETLIRSKNNEKILNESRLPRFESPNDEVVWAANIIYSMKNSPIDNIHEKEQKRNVPDNVIKKRTKIKSKAEEISSHYKLRKRVKMKRNLQTNKFRLKLPRNLNNL